jgi:tRNA-specific 2-thiouridylase
VRYRSKLKPAKIVAIKDSQYSIELEKPERAISPGQSAVFYDGEVVMGGGIIC